MDFNKRGFIECLDSKRNTINTQFEYSINVFLIDILRVTFKSNLTMGISIQWKTTQNITNFIMGKNRRSSSSKIQSIYRSSFIYRSKILTDLFFEVFDISPFLEFIKNRRECKFTIWALLSTKWNMEIKVHLYARIFSISQNISSSL